MTITTRTVSKFGWQRDLPDFRDHLFGITKPIQHPAAVSLRAKMPPVFDQGSLGSCTANASAAAFAFEHGGGPYSRLQLYYNERIIEGTVSSDSGAQLRDAVKVLNKLGVAVEKDWPYVESKFAKKPPVTAVKDAATRKISVYSSLQNRNDYRTCLASGYPFIVGFTVYESFQSDAVASTGVVPMPKLSESVAGGHAVCVIGYNTNIHGGDYYEVRNSWSESWGDHGNFWMPAAYLENPKLASDAWTIRK